MSQVQVEMQVELKQKSFSSNITEKDLVEFDKKINTFVGTMATDMKFIEQDQKRRVYQNKTLMPAVDKVVAIITYYELVEPAKVQELG